ncbi:DNA-binding protein [Gordonia sp. (in: high G+C Gram-positive bacteria)]|uniref:DNA-binding protein n=1 Tax=Gordonia sp. (in: high G+C Gram-positive bacteria) TaxID=84139 RepID=UPI0019A67B98|nr:DNA-binding protein [Gordonia sp. (in: high G+C Gram-positive bacteria)]MBD0020863.1 DNA-binding protein [Gordonia sp. (in: high G+C Gram-positive bacteria)]
MSAVKTSRGPAAPSTDPHDDLRVFGRHETAERLSVSVDVVDRLLAAGELVTVRPRKRGRIVQIPARSLREYIYGADGA